jgi:hypothetical protein
MSSNAADVNAPFSIYCLLCYNRRTGQMWMREYLIPLDPSLNGLRRGDEVWTRDYEANNRTAVAAKQCSDLPNARADWEKVLRYYDQPAAGWVCRLLPPHLQHCFYNLTQENKELLLKELGI